MIEQRARVVSVRDGEARIRTEAQTGCHSCGARSGCGSALIAQMFPARFNQQLKLGTGHLRVQPRPGDHVLIGIDEGYLQKVSLLLYAVPLLGLIGGALAGQLLTGSEPASILGGLLGLTGTLVSVRWGAERLLRAAPDAMRILRVEPDGLAVSLDGLRMQGQIKGSSE